MTVYFLSQARSFRLINNNSIFQLLTCVIFLLFGENARERATEKFSSFEEQVEEKASIEKQTSVEQKILGGENSENE